MATSQNPTNAPDATSSHSFTVGLVFLTDLFFLLRLPNFWELLSQPVSTFLEELYGPPTCPNQGGLLFDYHPQIAVDSNLVNASGGQILAAE